MLHNKEWIKNVWNQNTKSVSRYTSSDVLIRRCLDWKRLDAEGKEFTVIPRFNTVTYGKHFIKYFGPSLRRRLSKRVKAEFNLNNF